MAELWLGPSQGSGRRVLEAAHSLLGAAGVGARDLERVVVGVGPGGFTGLRIGLATALGLGQSLGVPVVGGSSLEALALGLADAAPGASVLVPTLDARRGELFAAAYRPDGGGRLQELMGPSAVAPKALAAALASMGPPELVAIGGAGLKAADGALDGFPHVCVEGPDSTPRARHLARRVAAGGRMPVVPVYARLPDAEVNRRARAAAERP